jgi:hypothetical protein
VQRSSPFAPRTSEHRGWPYGLEGDAATAVRRERLAEAGEHAL